MKVLVTGGAGLVGSHATKLYLGQGHEVTVIDNLARSSLLKQEVSEARKYFNINELQAMGATWVNKSVSDPATFADLSGDFELIVHLAAQTSVPTSIASPDEDFSVNAVGSFNVLEFARKVGATVVYASTNKVYPLHAGWVLNDFTDRWEWSDLNWHCDGFPLDGHVQKPSIAVGSRTPYGQSKYVGDLLCQEWYHTYGVRTGIFRMSCIADTNQFSFSEQGWLVHFVIQNLKGLPVKIFGDGKQVRDVLAARDLVKAYDAFFKSNEKSGLFNIGGGPDRAVSLNDALSLIEQVTNKPFTDITYEGWRPLDQRVYTSDIAPLKTKLDWEPELSVRAIIEDAVLWVEKNISVF